MQKKNEESPFNLSDILSLPAFRELEESESPPLTSEEKKALQRETAKTFAKILLELPAFRNLDDEGKSKRRRQKKGKSSKKKKKGKR